MRLHGKQSLPEAQDNQQFVPSGDSTSWVKQIKKSRLLPLGAILLVVAPVLGLTLIAKSTNAQADQTTTTAKVSSGDESTTVEVKAEAKAQPVAQPAGTSRGASVNLNMQSSTVSSSDPAQNKATTSLTVNGESIPVNESGTVEKVIHSSGDTASVNVTIDSHNSSQGEQSGDGQ